MDRTISGRSGTAGQSALLIEQDDLSGTEIAALLERHLAFCRTHSPPGSVHALDLDGLRRAAITFWTARRDGKLVGCIALKQLDANHGEIKSMHTAEEARGAGVARSLVEKVLAVAQERAATRLSLETGSMEAFRPARTLYEAYGFRECPPFGDYVVDPNSVCMTLALEVAR